LAISVLDYNRGMSESPIRDPESAEAAAVPITPPPITPLLSAAQRKALRAKAHELDPIVRIGDAGLSDAVIRETDLALTAHGLIKVRVFGDDREARETIGATLSERLGCALVQSIGKLLVLWREQPETALKKTPIRRRTESAPKKLAAEGKSAPRKRARPGVPKPEQMERAERYAPVAPARRPPIARGSRAPIGAAATSAAASATNRRPSTGSSGSSNAGFARKPGTNSFLKPAGKPARNPANKAGARPGAKPFAASARPPSAARPPAAGNRRSSASTTATGSARPGPRSRAGRRVP
jgi:RNA-binding protein